MAPRWAETGSRILPILTSARASPRSAAGPPDSLKAAGSIPGNRARRTADGPARQGLLRMPHQWAHRLAGWPGTGAALLMASINSSGLPLPAHARRLAGHSPFHTANPSPLPKALPGDVRTLGVQAGHQGLRQGPGMAEELLGAGAGRRVAAGGGKPCGRGKTPSSGGAHRAPGTHRAWISLGRRDQIPVFPCPPLHGRLCSRSWSLPHP